MERMKTLIAVGALAAAMIAAPLVAHLPIPKQSLTRDQVRSRADQLFERFDLNHDGYVTRDEAQIEGGKLLLLRASTGRDEAPGIGGHTLRFLRHRFAGMDEVTKQQFEAAFLAHFDEIDTNHDGILTAAERLKAR